MSHRRKVHFEADNRDICLGQRLECSLTPDRTMQNRPNLPSNPKNQNSSQPNQQTNHSSNQQNNIQSAAFPQPGYPYAYPYGWSYMHPVNPLNPAAMNPIVNPMYGMYFPYPVAQPAPIAKPSEFQPPIMLEAKSPPPVEKQELSVSPTAEKRAAFNLDDPEEYEKWKAERRKRFPSRGNSVEPVDKPEPEAKRETEEGELSDSSSDSKERKRGAKLATSKITQSSQVKKQTCKYSAAGKCKNGDTCAFAHDKTTTSKGQTVFETLQSKQEREDLLKFYQILKIIVNSQSLLK